MANNNMSPSTGEVITKSGEVVNLVDILGGTQPVDETVYDIRSYSPRTGLILGSDGKAYDLVELLQGGGSGPSGDCVTKEELAARLQPIQERVVASESKVAALDEKVEGMDAVSIDMIDELQKKLNQSEEKVDVLWKLSQGQVYDFVEKEENGMLEALKGAMYMTLDEIRGMTTQDYYHMGLAVDAGTVEGSAEAPIRELQMFGKTEQASTSGYALIPFEEEYLGGLPTIERLVDLPAGNYTFSLYIKTPTTSNGYAIDLYDADNVRMVNQYVTPSTTLVRRVYTRTAERPIKTIRFYGGADGCEISHLMLEAGDTVHEWEPFTGGIPSPNPVYQQEIQSVEEINMIVCGKNLVDISEEAITKKTGNFTFSGSEISCVSTSGWGGDYMIFGRYPARHDVTYYSSIFSSIVDENYTQGSGFKFIIVPFDEAGEIITVKEDAFNEKLYWTSYNTYYKGYIFKPQTTENDDYVRVSFSFAKKVRCFDVGICVSTSSIGNKCIARDVMLSFSDDTTYEPYEGQIRKITPPSPLNKVGELADICDVEKGLWIYKNKARTIKLSANSFVERSYQDSTDLYGSFLDATTGKGINDASNRMTLGSGNVGIIANKFRTYTGSSDIYAGIVPFEIGLTSGANFIRITVPCGYDFNQIGEVDCVYTLAQEEFEFINEGDLTFLRALMTYSEGTNVFITDQLGRDISSRFRFLRDGSEAIDDVVAPTPLYPSELHRAECLNVEYYKGSCLHLLKDAHWNWLRDNINEWRNKGCLTWFRSDLDRLFVITKDSTFNGVSYDNMKCVFADGKVTPSNNNTIQEASMYVYLFGDGEFYISGKKKFADFYIDSVHTINLPSSDEHRVFSARSIIPPRPLNRVGGYYDRCDIENGVFDYVTNTIHPENWKMAGYTAGESKLFSVVTPDSTGNIPIERRKIISNKVMYDSEVLKNDRDGAYAGYGNLWCRLKGIADEEEFNQKMAGSEFIYIRANGEELIHRTDPIDPDDLTFLRSLELLPADHIFTITDQDGNDISYLMEYIRKLSEVAS